MALLNEILSSKLKNMLARKSAKYDSKYQTFYEQIKPQLHLLKFFRFFPIQGLKHADPKHLKFKWISWDVFLNLFPMFCATFNLFCFVIYTSVYNVLALNALLFFGEGIALWLLYLLLAKQWPTFTGLWQKAECSIRYYNDCINVKKRILVMTVTILGLALVEHASVMGRMTLKCMRAHPDSVYNASRDYFVLEEFPQLFYYIPYSIWIGLIFKLLIVQQTFIWSYVDVFIIAISICFHYRLRQIFLKLRHLSNVEEPNELIWRLVRKDYVKLSHLCYTINQRLRWFILISFLNNTYHILTQLFNSLRPSIGDEIVYRIYFSLSFLLLILRITSVCLFGGAIYAEKNEITKVLLTVPTACYNMEVERFIMHLATSEMALTGNNLFKITRGLLLKVTSAIVTYELVLIQYDQQEFRGLKGLVWIKFLGSYKSPAAASSFVAKLVSKEIDCYLKYVYQLKSRREPDSYGGLPSHSVVRALGEFVKSNFLKMGKWESAADENLFTNCLRILSLKYSRPLPPLDWCFLQELIHVNSLSDHCLDLVSHQAILSGSARRLAENFIVAVTDEPQKAQETLNVYKNLVYLANSIQPMVLRPFLVNTLQHWSETVDDSLATALECLKLVLNNKEIQDVNKTVVEEVLADLMFVSNLESKTFNLILGCLASFSPKGQEKVTRFSSDPVGQEEFTKITKVRCCLAATVTTGTPLVWLNDIFVVAFKSHVSPNQYFDDLAASFKKRMGHEDSSQWLNELFGDIQAKVADRCPQEEIGLLCDVLTLAAACFSGLSVITPKYDHSSVKYFFPAVLKYLIEEPHWSYGIVQILEWLHYMNSSESIPEEYKNIFGWALASLRHEDEFAKSPRWLRYLDSQIYVNNVL